MLAIFFIVLVVAVIYIIYIRPLKHYISDDITKNLPAEFEELYTKTYNENHELFEKLMKKNKKNNFYIFVVWLIYIVVTIIIFIIFSFFAFHSNIKVMSMDMFEIPLVIALFIALGFSTYFENDKSKYEYRFEYKDKVFRKFIKLFNSNLDFTPEISPQNRNKIINFYKKADFSILTEYNVFRLEDYISGKIEDFNLDFAEIDVLYQSSKEKNLKTFAGSFCTITLPNKVDNDIRIVSEKFLKIFIYNYVKKGYKHVVMDNQDFENKFNIYAKNDISAMMLLTHDIMEKLLEFRNKFLVDFDMIIKENHIYIRFYTGNLFEPSHDEAMNKERILKEYGVLSLIVEFSKLINNILKEQQQI